MLKNSIFDLADKFGYKSPFGDWLNEDFKSSEEESLPTVSFKGKSPDKIEINKKTLIEFIISGKADWLRRDKFIVELFNSDPNISFTTKKWDKDGGAERGWVLQTNVTAKKEGSYVLQFKINGKDTNALNLFFYDKNEALTKKSPECLCKKLSWTSKDLKDIVIQLRKLDTRKIERNPLDKRGNRTYLDKDGNIILSTDTGERPANAVKRNIVIEDFSLFDDIAEDNKINGDRLFKNKANGQNIKSSEANYNEFSEQLNRAFTKYSINTCLRKIHFIAQIYQETNRFRSTYENVSGTGYSGGDFYQGRGMKQITHDYNYLEYYSYVNKLNIFDLYIKNRSGFESVIKFNERTNNQYISVEEMNKVNELVVKISTDMYYACDSAGWYWSKNKINEYADKDDIIGVSAKVNNPSAINKTTSSGINGFEERKKYYYLLKIIFDYENCK